MTYAEIVAAYPELDEEDIYRVLEYAAAALRNEVVLDIMLAIQRGALGNLTTSQGPRTADHRPRTNIRRPPSLVYRPGYTIHTPYCSSAAHHIYHQYTLRVSDGKRDALQTHLKERGISTAIYYPIPLHRVKVFAGKYVTIGELRNAEQLCDEVLSLPVEPLMPQNEFARIAETIRANNGNEC